AEALATLRATEFSEAIAALLKDRDDEARAAGVTALGRLGAKAYSKEIGKLLQEESMRRAAVGALAEMGAQDQVDGIREALKDQYSGAAMALAKLGRKDCADEIAAVLANPNVTSLDGNF